MNFFFCECRLCITVRAACAVGWRLRRNLLRQYTPFFRPCSTGCSSLLLASIFHTSSNILQLPFAIAKLIFFLAAFDRPTVGPQQ